MGKQNKNNIQINRRISKETKALLEQLENEGITLEHIIKDYVRLRKLENKVWKRVNKKLNLIIKGVYGDKLVVVEKSNKNRGGLLSFIKRIFS